MLFIALAGCNHTTSKTTINGGSTTIVTSAAAARDNPQLSRAPEAVRDSFNQEHPKATVQQVKPRLYPDQRVHYLITYTDEHGQRQEAAYFSDGSTASQ